MGPREVPKLYLNLSFLAYHVCGGQRTGGFFCMNNTNKQYDLVIIGGGIMGLMTAYYASQLTRNVALVEKSTIGNPQSASFGYTRSIRNDYLDPYYSRLAIESRGLWEDLERKSTIKLLITCGVLNIAKQSVTPAIAKTYASQSNRILSDLRIRNIGYTKMELMRRFPQFTADLGSLDLDGGLLRLQAIQQVLLSSLKRQGVTLYEQRSIRSIEKTASRYRISFDKQKITTSTIAITTGVWINDVLALFDNCDIPPLPITKLKPPKTVYFLPKKSKQNLFSIKKLPVFAYLDVGIFGHPMFEGDTPGVKVGYFTPPGFTSNGKITSARDFVKECIPLLGDAPLVEPKEEELGYFEMTPDGNFIVGMLPKLPGVSVAGGFCGTGYKFAPLIGKVLAQLSLQKGTVYEISKFSPNRFRQTR